MSARVAVVLFPGVNCEAETERALTRVGLASERVAWTRPARELAAFDAYVLPGGFSYQDRVRAGALAAKHPLVEVLAEGVARGRPVLGICNGAQVLVEAGLVPGGGAVGLALARNRMPDRTGYLARWVSTRVEASSCVFTRALEPGMLLPLPMAHGEGRFVTQDDPALEALRAAGQVPLRYASADGGPASGYPDNPNGSGAAAAAVCDASGHVMAIMPHPERALEVGALGRDVGGAWGRRRDRALEAGDAGAPGPGLLLFDGLRRHFQEA